MPLIIVLVVYCVISIACMDYLDWDRPDGFIAAFLFVVCFGWLAFLISIPKRIFERFFD